MTKNLSRIYDCICIGSGPAGLMAADILSQRGRSVAILEQRPSIGWKLLVAGSSGLNISSDISAEKLPALYGASSSYLASAFEDFSIQDWLKHLEELGELPYLGSSGRYFIKNKTAGKLLKTWQEKLIRQDVCFFTNTQMLDFSFNSNIQIHTNNQTYVAKNLLLATGGASWLDEIPNWPSILKSKKISLQEFSSSNCGYEIKASDEFFSKAEGIPIKGLCLKTKLGQKLGELMITKYGLEGTPIYTLGCTGTAFIDLKPDLSVDRLEERIRSARGDIHKKLKYGAKLSEGAAFLALEMANADHLNDSKRLAHFLKNVPVELLKPRPLSEAISSRGGVALEETNSYYELNKIPKVYCVGEMLAWDAPTGGFLIQACVSMAVRAAKKIDRDLI
ncbi:MAG: NAD(P)/FAD-dependent oxidoreductase [Oligoflexia bacterium]|nr:NAD(P)/FAD-dependent oxidoreductase [Oligoflexia bacterium]